MFAVSYAEMATLFDFYQVHSLISIASSSRGMSRSNGWWPVIIGSSIGSSSSVAIFYDLLVLEVRVPTEILKVWQQWMIWWFVSQNFSSQSKASMILVQGVHLSHQWKSCQYLHELPGVLQSLEKMFFFLKIVTFTSLPQLQSLLFWSEILVFVCIQSAAHPFNPS